MMGGNDALVRVADALRSGNCGQVIEEMETYLSAWPEPHTAERLSQLRTDYDMMVSYWRQGFDDPQREALYGQLLRQAYVLYANVVHYHRMKASPYQYSLYTRVRQRQHDWSLTTIRQEMEGFVSDVALLELEPPHKQQQKRADVYRRHQQWMNQLFEYIETSRQWSDGVGRAFEEMLLAPTVDAVDQQLIVTAVMLALMNQYDMAKFRTLVNVYRRSQDEAVRQRALVGWVLSLRNDCLAVYPEQQQLVTELLQSEAVCRELTELQLQLVYCINAEQDNHVIQQEIMPDLLKNQGFHITLRGVEEQEEDSLEDILHPDAAEQKMEQLEAKVQRMMDMQRQGSDIFFGGFSQMKRFPFFYDISNWLVPFYIQHPDIAQYLENLRGKGFLEKMVVSGPFCNSDKYSFVIAFQQVVDRIPESMRQMMDRGETPLDELVPEQLHSPAYMRRLYLMDLYRFFRLFPHRAELYNPFDTSGHELGDCLFFSLPLLQDTPLDAYKREVVPLLRKLKMADSAQELLATIPEGLRDVQYLLWTEDYEAIVRQQPDHERALVGLARRHFGDRRYDEALQLYERLTTLNPDKTVYQLNEAVCLLNMERYDEALKLLYRLNYEHEDDQHVCRALAWALTCEQKLQQAAKLYERLTATGQPAAEDYLNYGYCLWLQGQVDAAADNFRKYAGQQPVSLDEDWLKKRNISEVEINMMKALVAAA